MLKPFKGSPCRHSLLTAPLLAAVAFASPGIARGQNAQGAIVGHISDAQGNALKGAQVTVVNDATGVKGQFTTQDAGDYVFVNLSPGPYSVAVNAPGFTAADAHALNLEVEQTLRQNFKMTVGGVVQQVTVSADSQMLQTDNQTTGQVIHGDLVQALPIDGRDFTNLLQTNAGTSITPGGIQKTGYVLHGLNTSFQEVSVNGSRADSIAYSVDGVDDTSFFFSQALNIPGEMAIEEFKTLNGQYGAEYGRGAVQVNVAIKSGTNQYHGGLYDALQNSAFQPDDAQTVALNKLNSTDNSTHLPMNQNQFGGVLGGPATIPWLYNAKDKTFWFFSYDGARHNETSSPTSIVAPSEREKAGDFSDWASPIYDPATTGSAPATATNPAGRIAFANNQIPLSRFDTVAKATLPYFNTANTASCVNLASGCKNFSASVSPTIATDTETFRIDHNVHADHIFFTGNFGVDTEQNPSVVSGQSGHSFSRTRLFGLTWSHPMGANMVNQATFGYARMHFFTGADTAYGSNLTQQIGMANSVANPEYYGLPSICFALYQCIGGPSPYEQWDNSYQFVDTLTIIRGHHSINVGIDFRRIFLKDSDSYNATGSLDFDGRFTASNPGLAGDSPSGSNGAYVGNGFADFLLGQAASASGPAPLGGDLYRVWANTWNVFIQDNYSVTPNLTVNAGLRWERAPNFHSINNSGYSLNPDNGGSLVWASRSFTQNLLAQGGNSNYLQCCSDDTLSPVQNKNFAPRLGFSYRPPATPNLVVRGSYGLFYDIYNRFYDLTAFNDNALYSETAATYPTTDGYEAQSTAVLSKLWTKPNNALGTFTAASYTNSFTSMYAPHNPNPYNQQWSLDFQYALTPTLLLDMGYVGSHGVHELTSLRANAATPPTVADDACNSLDDAASATGNNANCLTDPNFQPIDTRTPMKNLNPKLSEYANVENSSYNALQVQLIQRPVHGLQYHLNYTYSKALGENSGYNNLSGEVAGVQDGRNVGGSYGPMISDQTHRVVATYSYLLPINRDSLGKLRSISWLLGGWTTSGIYQVASGFPFTVYAYNQYGSAAEQMGNAIGTYRADYKRSGSAFSKSNAELFNTADYSAPVLGRYGNVGKGTLRTPYFTKFDASFGKTFNITERQHLLYRAEIFNLGSTYHSNTSLLLPDNTVSDSSFGSLYSSNPQIGSANLFNPRKIQMTLQYTF